jgi:histidyl-tRNA synthetase
MSIDADNVAILIAKGVPAEKKLEIFNEAKKLREQGKTVTVQPMKKNIKQQIAMLEAEGYKEFKKIYND